jgi:hypothetical protein
MVLCVKLRANKQWQRVQRPALAWVLLKVWINVDIELSWHERCVSHALFMNFTDAFAARTHSNVTLLNRPPAAATTPITKISLKWPCPISLVIPP